MKENRTKIDYVTLDEFRTTCNKYYFDLTDKEICFLYIEYEEERTYSKIARTKNIIKYVNMYLTNFE